MPRPLNDEERQRLANLYATKTDLELENLATSGASLTGVAREVLRGEILRRGLNITVSEAEPVSPLPPTLPIVRVYRDLPDALIAQSILDSAEIKCFLFDETIVRLDWFYSYAVGQIKLRVAGQQDATEAIALLDAPRMSSFDVGGVGEYIEPVCANCKSPDISFRPLVKRLVYALLYVALPVLVKYPAWRCHSCGYEWRDGEPGEFNPLDWNLIRMLWIIGLVFDFASLIEQYGTLSFGFWLASAVICAVCLARYAVDRLSTHAFLIGLVTSGWAFFAWVLFMMRYDLGSPKLLFVPILFWSSFFVGSVGGLVLMAFTWLARMVVPGRKSSAVS